MSSELDIASQIQNDVLPKKAPEIKGLDIVAKTRSAAEVGGDCFDFMQKNENFYIYIGDVTGHGVPAGLVMIMVDTLMHAWSQTAKNAEEILVQINHFLHQRMSSQRFMTLVLLRWNELEQKLYYTGAGHEHILVYRHKTKTIEAIRSG
jgi:serine phosphatase RsbU (regulator of sigma subunit)